MADTRIDHKDTDPMVLELSFKDMRRVVNWARYALDGLARDPESAITPDEKALDKVLNSYAFKHKIY